MIKALTSAVITVLILVPQAAFAGAVWHLEISDYREPTPPTTASGVFSSFRQWLSSKTTVRRPPIGTTFTVHSSAYASSPYQTDSTPCITAAGTRVRTGVVASNFLPLGTILKINDQHYIVEDRMNARYNGQFVDIWFPSTAEALEFGRQRLQATIVEYGTPGQAIPAIPAPPSPIRPSVIERASLRFIAFTRALARAVPTNLNQYDVNCFR